MDQVVEERGQRSEPTTSGEVLWERKQLKLTAYSGYKMYTGTLQLHASHGWRFGVHGDLEDAQFVRLLASIRGIPDHDVYPIFEPHLTQFNPETLAEQDYFLKLPSMSGWDENDDISKLTLTEARINQILLAHPHTNLATYIDCIVRERRIVRLAFPKYVEILSDRLDKAPQQLGLAHFAVEVRETWMDSIQAAVTHLHSLGYAHNDISARNIMFDGNGIAMLIDLDSCFPVGEMVEKGGVK